jgi:hypothetical protein
MGGSRHRSAQQIEVSGELHALTALPSEKECCLGLQDAAKKRSSPSCASVLQVVSFDYNIT